VAVNACYRCGCSHEQCECHLRRSSGEILSPEQTVEEAGKVLAMLRRSRPPYRVGQWVVLGGSAPEHLRGAEGRVSAVRSDGSILIRQLNETPVEVESAWIARTGTTWDKLAKAKES
jgi:hypothetical protein